MVEILNNTIQQMYIDHLLYTNLYQTPTGRACDWNLKINDLIKISIGHEIPVALQFLRKYIVFIFVPQKQDCYHHK